MNLSNDLDLFCAHFSECCESCKNLSLKYFTKCAYVNMVSSK